VTQPGVMQWVVGTELTNHTLCITEMGKVGVVMSQSSLSLTRLAYSSPPLSLLVREEKKSALYCFSLYCTPTNPKLFFVVAS
jgi:hypothetical protein